MNRIERHGRHGEARVRYLDGDFQVLLPGTFVRVVRLADDEWLA